jgi:UPF0176 protein
MQKIILYYKFVPVLDPEAVRLWQRTLSEKLQLKGRVLISDHGINGTLGGEIDDLKAYIKVTKTFYAFKGIDFKWGDGSRDDFPKLSVRVRPEIVTFGVADKISVDEKGIIGGGHRLKPKQVHELVKKRGSEVVFFDGRNAYEASIGKFKGAIVPDVTHSRDFPKELSDPKYESIKDRPVVTYCTGGIRCEVLSMLMKQNGFKEVYQIDGGIQKYGETFGDDGFWEGSLYVFDGRMGHKFSDRSVDIGKCVHCASSTSNYENCEVKSCNRLMLACDNCLSKGKCPDCVKDKSRSVQI